MSLFKKEKRIENVFEHAWQMAWQRHRTTTVLILVLMFLTLLLFPIPAIIGIVYFGYFYLTAKRDFYRAFAKENDLEYLDTASTDTLSGGLFDIGHSKHVSHVLTGSLKKHPVRIFNYSFTVGTGKNSSTKNFTVFEISFQKTRFPYILLNSRTMYRSYGEWGESTIPLEEEFKNKYQLYCKEGYEIEVFQILTPSILRFLAEKMPEISIEFFGNKVIFYDDRSISKRSDLERIKGAIEEFVSQTSSLIENLHDDFAVLHPYYSPTRK